MIQNRTYLLKFALLVSAFFMWMNFSYGQKWFEILPGSKYVTYTETSGKTRMVGFLNFKYDGNTMFCDSLHFKNATQEMWAFGKVQINKADTLNLFCDSVYYNGKTKNAKLKGHVRLRDREYKVVTDTMEYNTKSAKATYRYGGRIENIKTNEVLTSQYGYFYPNTEESYFKGNVVYKSDKLHMTTDTIHYNYLTHKINFKGPTHVTTDSTKFYCENGWYNVQTEEGVLRHNARIEQKHRIISGDSLYYAPKLKYAEGRGGVEMLDTVQKISFRGNYLKSDGQTFTDVLTGNPLIKLMKSKDTIYLRADTLIHVRDSLDSTLTIRGGLDVRVFQNKIQAKSDSLWYKKKEGTMDFYGDAHFWSYNSELMADTIRAFIKNDTLIEKAHLYTPAFAANELDSGKYYNQMAGKEIWAYFVENELVKTELIGNAKTIFYPEEEKKTDTAVVVNRLGMNRLFSSNIRVYLDSGEVVRISFIKEPDGKFFPMDQLDETEMKLPEFKWNPAIRPKRWQELLGPAKQEE